MTTVKSIITLIALSISNITLATTLSCNWLESADHAPGFYKPAKIVMTVLKDKVVFDEDTFLFRSYSPCWTGNWSSCAFGFTYEGKTWEILKTTATTLEMSAPGAYWDAELKMNFEKAPSSLKRGEITGANFSGDDGDGVWFNDEAFACQKI